MWGCVYNIHVMWVLEDSKNYGYCLFAEAPLVVTQKLSVSTLSKVESRP